MSRTRTRDHRPEPRKLKPNVAALRRQRQDQRRLQGPRRPHSDDQEATAWRA